MLKIGIVGLPNVGKSTFFNALTHSHALAANYPFATIEPNHAVVEVKDPRVDFLASVYHPKKVIYRTIEFIDIAGLVQGASQGEGLGNKFLGHIRQVDAICHLVRGFVDREITHVQNHLDPVRDLEVINLELALADLEVINHRIERIGAKKNVSKEAAEEVALLLKIKEILETKETLRDLVLTKEEQILLRGFDLITALPQLIVVNLGEEAFPDPLQNAQYQAVLQYCQVHHLECTPFWAKFEQELNDLDSSDQTMFLESYEQESRRIDHVIQAADHLLHLSAFLTAGTDECRAWQFRSGLNARECAGVIHTDFEKGFIKAEVLAYRDFVTYGSYNAAREAGKVRIEGKDYLFQDGDMVVFRFNG